MGSWPEWVFMVLSLAPEHVINLITSVPDQAIDWSTFTDRTPPFISDFMRQVPLICFRLPLISILLIIFLSDATLSWWCVWYTLMSPQHVSTATRPSRLYVHLFKKLDNLLDRLDNWRTMRGSQSNALEWVHMDRNDTHYCSVVTLHRL
jgi:hypothetical protein